MPELLECLKRLAREYRKRKQALDKAEDDVKWGKPHELCEALNGCWDALAHLNRWIHERTGIPVYDLQEAAFRAGSAFGLAAYQVPLPPTTTMEPVCDSDLPEGYVPSAMWTTHAIEIREEPPEIFERRDLTAILPKLAELDRDPATALRVSEILAQHPGIVDTLGIDGPISAPSVGEDATAGPKSVGGRPGLTEAEERKRTDLLNRWKQASEADIPMKTFCKDNGISIEYLEKCVDWDGKRRARSGRTRRQTQPVKCI